MKTAQRNGVAVIELAGRFDAYGAPQLEKYLKQIYTEAGNSDATGKPLLVVVDLAQVNFIDSTGLATLVQGMKRCRERQGDVYLSGLQQPVRIIIELTRLDKVFSIFDTLEEALEKCTNEYQSQVSRVL